MLSAPGEKIAESMSLSSLASPVICEPKKTSGFDPDPFAQIIQALINKGVHSFCLIHTRNPLANAMNRSTSSGDTSHGASAKSSAWREPAQQRV